MNTVLQSASGAEVARNSSGKHLTFVLGRESYAIPVLKVREIIKLVPATAVPQMPDHIKGVINLRGKIIPVVDLRRKFELVVSDENPNACIIVVQTSRIPGELVPMGVIVDGVEEVVSIAASDTEETPVFGSGIDSLFVVGVAKLKGTVKFLLDIDRICHAPLPTSSSEPA